MTKTPNTKPGPGPVLVTALPKSKAAAARVLQPRRLSRSSSQARSLATSVSRPDIACQAMRSANYSVLRENDAPLRRLADSALENRQVQGSRAAPISAISVHSRASSEGLATGPGVGKVKEAALPILP